MCHGKFAQKYVFAAKIEKLSGKYAPEIISAKLTHKNVIFAGGTFAEVTFAGQKDKSSS